MYWNKYRGFQVVRNISDGTNLFAWNVSISDRHKPRINHSFLFAAAGKTVVSVPYQHQFDITNGELRKKIMFKDARQI